MKALLSLGLCSLSLFVSCGPAAKNGGPASNNWSNTTGPATAGGLALLDGDEKTNFAVLPLEGHILVGSRLWSGDHWPSNRGGINRRWNTPKEEGFDTISPSREELAVMNPEDIARLAPSEKYDLLMGRYDYPLKKEVAAKSGPMASTWEGIGNGWAVASSNHEEPSPKVLINPDGVSIPFGSADIKALLSYYYAFGTNLPPSKHLGYRCMGGSSDCDNDFNAGSFHVSMANKMGIKKESFIADIDHGEEVWNHPFESYKSEVLDTLPPAEGAPQGTARTLKIKTKVAYIDASVGNSWDPIIGSFRQVTTNRVYHYHLHLNRDSDIIGGEWISNDRPDFIWTMPMVGVFEGSLSGISQLIH